MATTWKILAVGQLADTDAALYTAPASTMVAVTFFRCTNTDSTSHTVFASVTQLATTTTGQICGGKSVAAGESTDITSDAQAIRLLAGDTINGHAETGSVVDYVICGSEQT